MSVPFRASVSILVLLSLATSYLVNQGVLGQQNIISGYLGQGVIIQYVLLTFAMLVTWLKADIDNKYERYLVIVLALVCRVALLPIEPYLSNDVYRYLFDGYIAGIGLDPYQISHDNPLLTNAVKEWTPPSEHLKYPTLYPPFAIFLLSSISHWGPETAYNLWKLMTFSASVGVMLLGGWQLKQLNLLRHFPLIALSPILIFEAGIGMHLDTLCALFVLLALSSFLRQYYFLCGICIGLGTLIKLLPLIIVFPLIATLKKWDKSVKLLSAVIITIFLGYSFAFIVGWQPIGSLPVFLEKFRFGSLFYFIFEPIFGLTLTGSISLIAIGAGLLAIVFAAMKCQHTPAQIARLGQITLLLPLVAGPVVYPWYLMAIIPLLAIYPNRAVLVWISLQPLTYEVLTQFVCCQNWQPQVWPMIISLAGLCAALIFDYFKPIQRSRDSDL